MAPKRWVIQIRKRKFGGDTYIAYFRKMRESGGLSCSLPEATQYEEEHTANVVRNFLIKEKAFPQDYELTVLEFSSIQARKGDKEIVLCK